MRVLGVVLALIAVVAGLWWWSRSSTGGPPGATVPEAPVAPSPEGWTETAPGGSPEDSDPRPPADEARSLVEVEVEPEIGEGAAPTGPTSRVFGRVVDADGAGLAGVKIDLHTVGEPWAEGVADGAFAAETGEDGRFELLVPLPTSDWISMTVRPSRFHAFTGRHFGRAGGRDQDPLVEGENDLGTFTLASTGAIAGVARGASGALPAGGRVRLDGSFPGGYGLGGPIADDGRYVIGHVPPGTYDVEAIAKGYLTARCGSIEVRAKAVSEGNDLVLEPAPAISGRVVDEQGAPVEGVRLWGWPVGSGRGAGDRSDAEGRFTIYLPQDEPYTLEASKPGYEGFGGRFEADELVVEPGTNDVEVVLRRAGETTFVVISAMNGEPVERFGLSIGRKPGEGWGSSTERDDKLVQDIAGGVVTLFADPGEHAYSIQAPGYAPQRETVVHDSPESARQTIRLQPEGRIRGRVLFEGRPVARATVRVERGKFSRPPAEQPEEPDFWDDGTTYDLDAYVGRLRIHTTGAEGGFDVGELATGTYRVELSAAVGSPRVEEELRVEAGETLDLGDLELIAGGVVRGRVVVGAGAAAPGLEVFLDEAWDENRTTVGADGTFAFEGLAPGAHTLVVEDTPGVVRGMEPQGFHVASGQTVDVLLDLTPWQPCRLLVRVRDGAAPVAGAVIKTRSGEGHYARQIGSTSSAGELQLERRAGDPILIDVDSAGGLFLGGSSEAVELPPGGDVLVEIPIRPGGLAIELPDGVVLPELANLFLRLACEGQPRADEDLFFQTESMEVGFFGRETQVWSSPRHELGPLAPGRYAVELHVRPLRESEEGGYVAEETPPMVLRGEVEVVTGAEAVCTPRLE